MNSFIITFLLLSLFLLLHSYLFYPVSIWTITKIFNRKYLEDYSFKPKVSLLISVFNEEKVIESTLKNLYKTKYPLDKIEVIVGSDNSIDRTNEILDSFMKEFSNLKISKFQKRRGKASVLNDIFKISSGEILIFCDANTIFDPNAINNLVRFYINENVGGVSGKLILTDFETAKKAGSQEKKYWDAETWLKKQEGKIGILIGANGGIYSIRKKYFEEIPTDFPVMDDFYISLKVLEKRKDFLYAADAIAKEYAAPTIRAEFNRKIRNNSIMMTTIKTIKLLLNPKFGLISYALWSHKIIRWFTPVLLLIIFLSNLFLLHEWLGFVVLFLIQLAFYLSAVLGYLLKKINIKIPPLLLGFYFVMTNVAMFIGILKFLSGKQKAYWQSTPR